MFNKKIIPLTSIALASVLALTGCSVGEGVSNQKPSSDAKNVSKDVTGQKAVDDFNAIYNASVTKANTDGYVSVIAGNDTIGTSTDIYDPTLSTTQGIAIVDNVGTRIDASFIPNFTMFPELDATEAKAYSVTETADGTFTFVDNSKNGTVVTITTANGIETSLNIVLEGKPYTDMKFTYGLTSSDKELIARWFENTKDDIIVVE